MLSREATNTNFLVFGVTRPGLKSRIYHTRGKHANHYVTDVVDHVNSEVTAYCNKKKITCNSRQKGFKLATYSSWLPIQGDCIQFVIWYNSQGHSDSIPLNLTTSFLYLLTILTLFMKSAACSLLFQVSTSCAASATEHFSWTVLPIIFLHTFSFAESHFVLTEDLL